MLESYLTSVIIYMIIIYCTCSILKDGIKAKGWTTNDNGKTKLSSLFMLAAVPVLRVAVLIVIIYMFTYTKEDFEKWYKEVQEK